MGLEKNKRYLGSILLILLLGAAVRLWNINFGLPHSWYADEPELGEPAIKYTYELKTILRNNDIYKLIPESYVYGTLPVYFYTSVTMLFSKTLGVFSIAFSKMDLYVFMRVLNALISFALIPVFYLLVKRLGLANSKLITIAGVFLVAFNWKLIVHAHYLNHDIIITLLLLAANLFYLQYLQRRHTLGVAESDTANTVLFAVFFGLAVSTKITVLLTLPIYLAVFLLNKDYRNFFAACFIIMGVFIVTNPFAWVFMGDFFSRLLEMRSKEGGMVFDSVNYSLIKYISALAWILTAPVSALAVLGSWATRRELSSSNRRFYTVMALQILVYLVFFSLQSRRVDRWMLPILPNMLLFALVGLQQLTKFCKKNSILKRWTVAVIIVSALYYLYFPVLLLTQFQRTTPKSAAYIWAKDNLPVLATKFGVTEEGLDPLNKLPAATIWQFNAYESKGAQFVYPPDPLLYDYIIVSSRPAGWINSPDIANRYPHYVSRWAGFYRSLAVGVNFEQLKAFTLTEPNLIPLSQVYIYKNLRR